jgi:hypothetical protein
VYPSAARLGQSRLRQVGESWRGIRRIGGCTGAQRVDCPSHAESTHLSRRRHQHDQDD